MVSGGTFFYGCALGVYVKTSLYQRCLFLSRGELVPSGDFDRIGARGVYFYYQPPSILWHTDSIIYEQLTLLRGASLWVHDVQCSILAQAAILTELTEMWETPQEYAQDKWNWLDVASLLLLSSGLYVRIYGEGVDIGRVFYALSAPLVFSRFLFFAQILPRQGLVIQVTQSLYPAAM